MSRTERSRISRLAGGLLVSILFVASSAARGEHITGKVTLSGGGAAASVAVSAVGQPSGFPIVTVMTDSSGNYDLTVTPACYLVVASDATLGTIAYPSALYASTATIVNVASGQTVSGINIQFIAGHKISGTLSASPGPLPVTATATLLSPSGEQSVVQVKLTGAAYEFDHLPNGQYYVVASDAGFPPAYANTFFGGAHVESAATTVAVSGADVTGKNISMSAMPHIKGHVTLPGGGAAVGGTVSFFLRGGTFAELSTLSDASGNYDLSGLPPGEQGRVGAFQTFENPQAGFEDGSPNSFTSDFITLAPGDNTGHDIAEPKLGTWSGKITQSGTSTPISGASVSLSNVLFITRLSQATNSSSSNASGDYTITAIRPGRYTATISPPFSPTDFHLSKTVSSFMDINGNDLTGMNYSLDLGGRIHGTITKQVGGAIVPFASILVFTSPGCAFLTSAFGGTDGTYTTPALPVGDYRLSATAFLDPTLATGWSGGGTSCATATAVHVSVSTTATENIQLPPVSAAGFKASGRVTDSVTHSGIPSATLFFTNQGDATTYFAFADGCGDYSATGLTAGTYNASIAATGYRALTATSTFTVTSSNVTKDYVLTALTGAISGKVTSASNPVEGAKVCVVASSACALSDQAGNYEITGLDTGTYKVVSDTRDGLQGKFYNNKADLPSADGVAVTDGSTTTGINFDLVAVAADAFEPDDVGTPSVLSRPDEGAAPVLLRPDAPMNRAFRDAEDADWFRIALIAGKVYKVAMTGGLFSYLNPFRVFFDGATHAPVTGAIGLFTLGYTAPSSGDLWVGMTAGFSGAYTLTLTVGTGGPTPPTVTSLSVTSGPASGGTAITITGTGFVAGATVKIGGVAATNVVFVGATSITCKSPALPAGTLNDVLVTIPGPLSGTLTKGWFSDFSDVPQAYLYHAAIEKIVRAGITSGCATGKYCPNDPVTRDAMAKFLLVAKHGSGFSPPAATGTVFCDVSVSTLLAKWIEEVKTEGIASGAEIGACGKPNYHPTDVVTRDAMAKFLELALHGSSFSPPAATGTVFCDVTASTFLAKWMEQLKADGITSGCSGGACGKPDYCPGGTVSRGEMAKFLRVAFGL